jgi:hypothetical protein
MKVSQVIWLPVGWSMAILIALLAFCSSASAQTSPNCAGWDGISGWKGTYSLSASGSGMIGTATVTVNYSSSGNLNLTRPSPPPCPATTLDWESVLDATNAQGSASYQITAACPKGGIVKEYFSTSKVGPSGSADLKMDLSNGSFTFSPLVFSAPFDATAIDCKGHVTTVPLPGLLYTPLPNQMPLLPLPATPQALYSAQRQFQARDNLSSLTLTWTLTFTLTPDCEVPVGEITSPDGWFATQYQWKQTLVSGIGASFGGLNVKELDAGGGEDTCWFPGSAFNPVTSLSGGTWTVNPDNTWGDDVVGWGAFLVVYYQQFGKLPCGFTLHQQMQIACYDGSEPQYGPVNTLRGLIGNKTVGSERAGHTASRRMY